MQPEPAPMLAHALLCLPQVLRGDAGERSGAMRYGNDVIEIGPGAVDHGMWQMREAEPAPNHVRVLLTFVTPVDCAFAIRAFRGLKP